MRPVLVLFLGVLLAYTCAIAQVTTGSLQVRVARADGRQEIQAALQLQNADTGFAARLDTDEHGLAQFTGLKPADGYRLTVASGGYQSRQIGPVAVHVGETATIKATLEDETPQFQLTVTAALPPIDFEKTHETDTLEEHAIGNLPINRRNFLDFALLTPGVKDSATLADGSDFRIVTGPTSGLSFNGSNGRNNNISIDGFYINGYSGNVRPSVPETAVREFQVSQMGAPAETGWASGGTVNIVSQSGTTQFHGAAFGFLRDRAIQARNYFDPAKSAFTREQSGGNLSGPLMGKNTFFFAAYERLDRHETAFVPILEDPSVLSRLTPSQQQLISYLIASPLQSLGQALSQALVPSNNPAVTSLFQKNSGAFPFSEAQNQGSFRLDKRWTARQTLFGRFNITRDHQENATFGALHGFSNGNYLNVHDFALAGSHTIDINARLVNTAGFAFSSTTLDFEPNDPFGPEFVINGFGTFGRDWAFPLNVNEHYFQAQDLLAYSNSAWTAKFGGDLNWATTAAIVENYQAGQFTFGEGIPLGVVIDGALGNPNAATSLASTLTALGQPQLAASLNAPINSLQAFSLGLPLAYVQVFGGDQYNATRQMHGQFADFTWHRHPGLTLRFGVRNQFVDPTYMRAVDDVDPRFGFAWAPTQRANTVIRGGFGIFHDGIISTIPFGGYTFERADTRFAVVPITGVPGVINPQTGQPVTAVDVYQTLLSSGILGKRTIQASDLAAVGIPPTFNFPAGGGLQSNYQLPYSEQAHLAIEHSWGNLVISAAYNFSRSLHLWRVRDTNLISVGTRPDGYPIYAPKNPALTTFYEYESSGKALYSGGVLRVSQRLTKRVSFDAHFTYSRALDDVTDFYFEYEPFDPLNARAEWALSPFHEKYQLVASGVLESPVQTKGNLLKWLAADWIVAPIVRANSGQPFNVITGVDALGEGEPNNERPFGLGRDAGSGPAMFDADLRLTRYWTLNEKSAKLRFTAEVFNATNHTNFLSVNNVVGPVPINALPTPLTGHRGSPTEPLAYTAASDSRQFQFGLQLQF